MFSLVSKCRNFSSWVQSSMSDSTVSDSGPHQLYHDMIIITFVFGVAYGPYDPKPQLKRGHMHDNMQRVLHGPYFMWTHGAKHKNDI